MTAVSEQCGPSDVHTPETSWEKLVMLTTKEGNRAGKHTLTLIMQCLRACRIPAESAVSEQEIAICMMPYIL